jgi:acyl carrier protein
MTSPHNGVDSVVWTVSDVLGIDPATVSDDSSPQTIAAWDSFNHLNLVLALEEAFHVTLEADDVLEMGSVARIRDVLRRRGVVA